MSSFYANVTSVLVKLQSVALVLFTALIANGCTKSEPPKQAASPVVLPIISAPPPKVVTEEYVPRKPVDYMAGLKDIKDYKPPVKAEPVKVAAAIVPQVPRKAAEIKAAPEEPKVAETPPPAPSVTPQLIPAKAPPADNLIAKAAPTLPTPAVVTTATPIKRETPEFPREATRASVDSGVVRALLSIDASGSVTGVQIVEARPARVFDRAVRESLGRWRFNPGADGRSYQTEVEFRREP